MQENRNIEYKRIWKDEYFTPIAAFANADRDNIFSGISKIVTDCKRNIFPVLQIEERFNGVEVTFHKNEVNVTDNVPLNVPLNKRQENILKDIFLNRNITQLELAKKYQVTDKTIKRDLQYLQKHNIIKRTGSKKTGYWEIVNNDE